MGLVTEHNHVTPNIGSRKMMTEGSKPDLGQQVHTEIGSGIGPILGERRRYDRNHREQREEIIYASKKF